MPSGHRSAPRTMTMTTDERARLEPCLTASSPLAAAVYELSRQLGRAITAATTAGHAAWLDSLRTHAEDARQLLIAVHDELAEMHRAKPSDARAERGVTVL